jgi:hypothetical protein
MITLRLSTEPKLFYLPEQTAFSRTADFAPLFKLVQHQQVTLYFAFSKTFEEKRSVKEEKHPHAPTVLFLKPRMRSPTISRQFLS